MLALRPATASTHGGAVNDDDLKELARNSRYRPSDEDIANARVMWCSMCGAGHLVGNLGPAPEACRSCGARSTEDVRWWNSIAQHIGLPR